MLFRTNLWNVRLVDLWAPGWVSGSHHIVAIRLLAKRHESVDNSRSEDSTTSKDRVELNAQEDWNEAHDSVDGGFVPELTGLAEAGDLLDEIDKLAAKRRLQSDDECSGSHLEKDSHHARRRESDQTEDTEEEREEASENGDSFGQETDPPWESGVRIVLRLHLSADSRCGGSHVE